MLKKFILNFFIINFFSIFNTSALTIAQITDIHIGDRLDDPNLERLDRVLKHLKAQKPDIILATGDFTRKPGGGAPSINKNTAYKILKQRLDDLHIPYFVIPGNHDFLHEFHLVFPPSEHLNHDGFFSHVLAYGNVLIYGLDALHQSTFLPKGFIAQKQLDWLKASLAYNTKKKPYKKIIVFVHQPPIDRENVPIFVKSPFEQLYDYCFEDQSVKALFNILNAYPAANSIFAGHLHMGGIFKLPKGKYLYVSPSVAPTKKIYLDRKFLLELMGIYVSEDPGYSLYDYNETTDVLRSRYFFINAKGEADKVKPSTITAIDFHEAEKKYHKN